MGTIDQIDPTFRQREEAINRSLDALRRLTIPGVREKTIAEVKLFVATNQEFCRQANINYIPPVIPDPPKPAIEVPYENIILKYDESEPLLAHIIDKKQMPIWRSQLFCFFSSLRFMQSGTVPKACLEIEWSEAIISIQSFEKEISFISLQNSPMFEGLFKKIQSFEQKKPVQNFTELVEHTSEKGSSFVVCWNGLHCFSLWVCKREFLLLFTNVHNSSGLITGQIEQLEEKLKSFQSYIFGRGNFSVVKVVKKE